MVCKPAPWQMYMSHMYRKISNLRRTKSPNLNVSRFVLQLSSPNPMNPGVKSRMKMYTLGNKANLRDLKAATGL